MGKIFELKELEDLRSPNALKIEALRPQNLEAAVLISLLLKCQRTNANRNSMTFVGVEVKKISWRN
jgi:hypothetical protein